MLGERSPTTPRLQAQPVHDFRPSSEHYIPGLREQTRHEVMERAAAGTVRFRELADEDQALLRSTDRFALLVGQKLMPELQGCMDKPGTDLPREKFYRKFSGDLSARGHLLDVHGSETIYRADRLADTRINSMKQDEIYDSALSDFLMEQALLESLKTPDDI